MISSEYPIWVWSHDSLTFKALSKTFESIGYAHAGFVGFRRRRVVRITPQPCLDSSESKPGMITCLYLRVQYLSISGNWNICCFFHFSYYVLHISPGLEAFGTPVRHITLCLLLTWTVLCIILIKGINSLGKVRQCSLAGRANCIMRACLKLTVDVWCELYVIFSGSLLHIAFPLRGVYSPRRETVIRRWVAWRRSILRNPRFLNAIQLLLMDERFRRRNFLAGMCQRCFYCHVKSQSVQE